MPETMRSSEGLDLRRRKLLFRCWHRGIREMDLILGPFANEEIEILDGAELDEFEHLTKAPDPDLLSWITGEFAVPPEYDTPIFRRLRDFHWRLGTHK
jgi:antitoxin CptB